MRKLFHLFVFLISITVVSGQEINATISVNSDKIPGSNKQIFKTLETSLNEFVNQKRWTNLNYKAQERVACNFTITIIEQSGNDFKATIQIQSSRPVYNSSYLSPIFNFKDNDFSFQYTEYQPLTFSESRFESNLVSVISFYTYIILGLDADTFLQEGGTPYYNNAQNILVQAQQSGYIGWNQNDGSASRFVLIDNLLSPTYTAFRNVLLGYHLNGLDLMNPNQKEAKSNIFEAISNFKQIYDTRPNAFLMRVFIDSKADEIVNIFSDGPRFDTFKLKEELLKISPINAAKWNSIK